jgi:hypothetical protein
MKEQNRRLENQGVCPNYLTTYRCDNLISVGKWADIEENCEEYGASPKRKFLSFFDYEIELIFRYSK